MEELYRRPRWEGGQPVGGRDTWWEGLDGGHSEASGVKVVARAIF